ncbi:MAG: cyclodeaminase/cyclohydrolase family protein, partial [Salibacteraceae bacterium]
DVMETCTNSMEVMLEMAKTGLPASISDAGVGALCARAAIRGAHLNVKINAADLDDRAFIDDIFTKAETLSQKAKQMEADILALVEEKM